MKYRLPQLRERAAAIETPPLGRIFGFDDGLLDLRSFLATRRALMSGEALYLLSPEERRARGLMNPWLFNLQETILATIPASLVVWFLTVVYGNPPLAQGLSGHALYYAEIMRDIEPILATAFIPLTLMVNAPLLAWSSFRPGDATPDTQRRNTWAYLYVDGAYGLWAQLVMTLILSITQWSSAWESGPQPIVLFNDLVPSLTILAPAYLLLMVALVHEWRVLFKRVPETLFELNGYVPQVGLLVRVKDPNAGPVTRYNLTALFGTWLASLAVAGVLYGLAAGIAWILAFLKALLLNLSS